MNFKKKIFPVVVLIFFVSLLSGCSGNQNSSNSSVPDESRVIKSDKKVGYQLEMPQKGEEIAVMTTNFGKIKMRFFEDGAPKAVENFKTHSKRRYYNGLTFHRVIKGFMIQGGDPKGNGTGGKSIWNKPFADEFSDKLFNIRGAVAMANSGKNTNGSQFFINQTKASDMRDFSLLEDVLKDSLDFSKVTDDIRNLYKANGGNINLDGALNKDLKGHTVFAQVFEGMDIVDNIANVKVDAKSKPVEKVTIEKIEIEKYQS